MPSRFVGWDSEPVWSGQLSGDRGLWQEAVGQSPLADRAGGDEADSADRSELEASRLGEVSGGGVVASGEAVCRFKVPGQEDDGPDRPRMRLDGPGRRPRLAASVPDSSMVERAAVNR